MKQLKFMLAAATAISLATAAQAGATDATLVNEDFNSYPADQVVTAIEGFSFNGTAGDNESAIIAETDTDKALKVNTGTDPLLRALDYDDKANDVNLADPVFNYLTIDTKVQFTVTPHGDSVTAVDDDKLMIYFKEDLSDAANPKTNLVVKALQFAPESAPGVGDGIAEEITVDTGIGYPTIEPNTWYSLVVTSTAMDLGDGTYLPVFKVKVNDIQLTSGQISLANDGSFDKFPSIQGAAEAPALTYVGFAGEGSVDDLVVTKNYNVPDAVDYTFVVTWDTGISAVAYTIGGETKDVPTDGFKVPKGATVELAVTLKDSEWTKLADGTVLKFENVAADNENINLTTVKIAQKVDPETGNVVVNENATVEEIKASAGITEGYFAGTGDDAASKAEFQAVLNWKKNKGGSKANINSIDFTAAGDPEGDNAKAYLLDCDVDAVATEEAKFVFTGFDPANGGAFTVGSEKNAANGAKYGNGKVEVRGKAALSDTTWSKDCEKPAFFKAFLVK